MKYQCICCEYETDRSDNFTKHNDTKKHKNNLNKNTKNAIDNSFTCDICLKISNSKTSMYRHYKICKEIYERNKMEKIEKDKKQIEIDKKQIENEKKKIEDDKKKIEELQTTVNEIKIILNEKIKEIKELNSKNIYNITNNNNTTNHTTNNSINTVNNVTLSYVDTDDSHISDEDYKKIVNTVNFCVKMLVWKKHFNKDKPENMN